MDPHTLGNAAFKRGDYDSAVRYYTQVLLDDDDHGQRHIIHGNRSLALLRLRFLEQAIADAECCVELSRGSPYETKALFRLNAAKLAFGMIDDLDLSMNMDNNHKLQLSILSSIREEIILQLFSEIRRDYNLSDWIERLSFFPREYVSQDGSMVVTLPSNLIATQVTFLPQLEFLDITVPLLWVRYAPVVPVMFALAEASCLHMSPVVQAVAKKRLISELSDSPSFQGAVFQRYLCALDVEDSDKPYQACEESNTGNVICVMAAHVRNSDDLDLFTLCLSSIKDQSVPPHRFICSYSAANDALLNQVSSLCLNQGDGMSWMQFIKSAVPKSQFSHYYDICRLVDDLSYPDDSLVVFSDADDLWDVLRIETVIFQANKSRSQGKAYRFPSVGLQPTGIGASHRDIPRCILEGSCNFTSIRPCDEAFTLVEGSDYEHWNYVIPLKYFRKFLSESNSAIRAHKYCDLYFTLWIERHISVIDCSERALCMTDGVPRGRHAHYVPFWYACSRRSESDNTASAPQYLSLEAARRERMAKFILLGLGDGVDRFKQRLQLLFGDRRVSTVWCPDILEIGEVFGKVNRCLLRDLVADTLEDFGYGHESLDPRFMEVLNLVFREMKSNKQ